MRPVPCVGVIVCDGAGRMAVVRRKNPPAPGRWSIPGGRVDPGEPLTVAALREVMEETGLRVELGEVAGTVTLPAPGGGAYAVTDFFATLPGGSADAVTARAAPSVGPVAELVAAELVAGDDASEARWVTRAELEALPTSPGLVATLTRWDVWDRLGQP